MAKTLVRYTLLRDAITNFWVQSGADDTYCKGLLVGVVSTLMATGMTFEEALHCAAQYWPADTRLLTEANVPESWLSTLNRIMEKPNAS